MLFWLPSTWGAVDEDGEYRTLATSLATLFASGGLFLIGFLDKATHEKVKRTGILGDLISWEDGVYGTSKSVFAGGA